MATEEIILTTSWQLVGATPVLVTLEVGSVAELHLATSTPAAAAPAHRIGTNRGDRSWLDWPDSGLNVYAKKSAGTSDAVKLSYTTR